MRSRFIFTLCQVGAEKALKKEVEREHPDLRFAYSRPGFVTFKTSKEEGIPADFELKSVFARAYGLSLGALKGTPKEIVDQFLVKIREFSQSAGVTLPVRMHLFERDQHAPSEEPLGYEKGLWVQDILEALGRNPESSSLLLPDAFAEKYGEPVVDLTCLEAGEAWIGFHLHGPAHSAAPGGDAMIELPEEAPSRAYLKLEEALFWSGAPVRAGDHAVEIGSAPGGASLALLQRGVSVVGIDPGEMDPRVLKFRGEARFRHIAKPVAQVPREDLPQRVDWLLLDMNVEPRISVFSVDRLATRLSDSLLGVLLTIKLNQWKIADQIPGILEHIQAMGMVRVRATQLPHAGREFFVYGLTRKGMGRLKS